MAPFVASWGIVGAGNISSLFVEGLCPDRPELGDIVHSIAAVASRDQGKAAAFINPHCPGGTPAQQRGQVEYRPEALGSYRDLYTHKQVNVVYIGTVNPMHHVQAKAVLESGKNVVLEKPATLNAAEWMDLCSIAKKNGVFLMESKFSIAEQLLQR